VPGSATCPNPVITAAKGHCELAHAVKGSATKHKWRSAHNAQKFASMHHWQAFTNHQMEDSKQATNSHDHGSNRENAGAIEHSKCKAWPAIMTQAAAS